jgi:hypothetical protein
MLSRQGQFKKYVCLKDPCTLMFYSKQGAFTWKEPRSVPVKTDGDRNCAICKLGYYHLGECEVCSEEPSSSVSIVSGYGLDDRAIEVRSLAGAKDFSCRLCVQTGSGAHPVSCTMGTGGPFPGVKARPGRDADHSPLSSAEVENE